MKDFLFYAICASLAVQVSVLFSDRINRSSQRRIYWGCACAVGIFSFAAFWPDAKVGLEVGLSLVVVLTFAAYAYTPYLKIGGKIYSITVQNSRPDPEDADTDDSDDDAAPDAYSGVITAKKYWWILALFVSMLSADVYLSLVRDHRDWIMVAAIAALPALALIVGYGDASWNYPIARSQYLQFALTGIVTASAFPVLYLLAYYAGKHWPLRNKRSMEYRSHPRHQRLDGN